MARLTITSFTSIDGVCEAPGGEPGYAHTGWVGRFPDRDQFGWKLRETLASEVTLLGRITYDSFYGAWPNRDGAFADKLNTMKKVVVSTTLHTADWANTTIISTDVAAAIARLKAETQGEILVHGSRTLVNFLKAHDLIDRYTVMVFPIILGSGKRLFDATPKPMQLKLTDVQRFDDACTVMTFDRDRS
jgi:dihydrofolate reductase